MSHFAATVTETHLTPPHIIAALGGADSFDLDPCAAPLPRPWPTARAMVSLPDNGLMVRWKGRIFLNPPYTGSQIGRWLRRMAAHGQGVTLINATTETDAFQRFVWEEASGLLFLKGRLVFCDATGAPLKGKHGRPQNNPAPSVLCAYGQDDLDRLAAADLDGKLVPLRFARFVLLAGLDQSWAEAMRAFLARQRGPVSVAEAYRYFSGHPKARRNPNWRAKVRQQLQLVGDRVAPATYQPRLI